MLTALNAKAYDTLKTTHIVFKDSTFIFANTTSNNYEGYLQAGNGLMAFTSRTSLQLGDATSGSSVDIGSYSGYSGVINVVAGTAGRFIEIPLRNYSTEVDTSAQFLDSAKHNTFAIGSRGTISLRDTVATGQHAFTTTATVDSMAVTGGLSTDYYFVTPQFVEGTTTFNANDALYAQAKTGWVIVMRNAGGTSGLKWNWLRVRPKH